MYDTIKKEILLLLKVGFWSNYYILNVYNCFTGQEATDKTGHGTTDWFQIGKGVH